MRHDHIGEAATSHCHLPRQGFNPSSAKSGMFQENFQSIPPWLWMPLLLVSPGHQQPWYQLHRTRMSLSSVRKVFNNLCHLNDNKC